GHWVGGVGAAPMVSLVLVPGIGSLQAERIMLWAAAISAIVILWPEVRATKSTGMAAVLAAGLVAAAWLASNMGVDGLAGRREAVPGELIAYGRRMVLNSGKREVLYTV